MHCSMMLVIAHLAVPAVAGKLAALVAEVAVMYYCCGAEDCRGVPQLLQNLCPSMSCEPQLLQNGIVISNSLVY